jgi:hypothetical protein
VALENHYANNKRTAAIAIYPLWNGYRLMMNHSSTSTEMSDVVIAAIDAKW